MNTRTTEVSFQSSRPSLRIQPGAATQSALEVQWLEGRQIDSDRATHGPSHQLRYRVYCVERGFLNPDDYPDQRERDEFDSSFAASRCRDGEGSLLATARLVKVNLAGLPLFRHCQIYARESELYHDTTRVAEISRLCVSRELRERRIGSASVAVNLYRAIYQAVETQRLHALARRD